MLLCNYVYDYAIRERDKNVTRDIIVGLSNFQSRVTCSQSYYNALAKRFMDDASIEHMG